MPTTNIQSLFSERIGGKKYGTQTGEYKFGKILRAKEEARKQKPHLELFDFGVGEPDDMAPRDVVEILYQEAGKEANRIYPDNGGPILKQAAARYMQNIYGVKLDPETQVIHSIGSKAALTILPAVLINPGDIALMTTPGYPVFGIYTTYYGGKIHALPLLKENNYLPDLKSIPANVLSKAKVLVINYPNNPTGASATESFFQEVVEFAHTYNLVVIHDAAYAPLIFEGKPLSFLQTHGAMEIGLELHTTSKAFNMTGWRCGFVTGNPLLVRAYGDVKANTDCGQFLAIQHASAYAFDHPEITQKIAAKYSRRMDLLVPMLRSLGFDAHKPKGSFFLYVASPKAAIPIHSQSKPISFESAEAFSQWLIREHLISTVPWDEAGPHVRWSVTFKAPTETEEKRVIEEVRLRLSQFEYLF